MQHASQSSRNICASGESKHADFITITIILHEELVAAHDMSVDASSYHTIDDLAHLALEGIGDVWNGVGADPCLIVYKLLLVGLPHHGHQLHKVGVIIVELVASSVKGQDQTAPAMLWRNETMSHGSSGWCVRM